MAMRIDSPPPSVSIDPHGGGGSGWVQLIVATNDIDAHLLTGRLGAVGIDTYLVKDRSGPGAWLYGGSDPWAPVRVHVRAFQLDDARLVLAEVELSGPAEDPRIRYQPMSGRMWWAIAIALGLFFTGVALARTADALQANTVSSCDLPLLCGEDRSR